MRRVHKPKPHLSARLKGILLEVAKLTTPQEKEAWLRERRRVVPRMRWFLCCLRKMGLVTLASTLELPTLTEAGSLWVENHIEWARERGTIAQTHPARERIERARLIAAMQAQQQQDQQA